MRYLDNGRLLTLLFVVAYGALAAGLLLAAGAAGTLVVGCRESLALRCAAGFALWGEALFLLAAVGSLRPIPIALLFILVLVAAVLFRWRRAESAPRIRLTRVDALAISVGVVMCGGMLLLALHPPLAFDETMYHQPFVRALTIGQRLQFLGGLRFPLFPQFQELLAVPAALIGGDVATHLLPLLETIVTAGIVIVWGERRQQRRAGLLAAALLCGNPIVLHLGTILYVDSALLLFVTSGFYMLDRALDSGGGVVTNVPTTARDRRRALLLSALFFGAACSTKYLGGYFALAALLIVIFVRRRDAPLFAIAIAIVALPTTFWIWSKTGNPLFPFASALFGANDWQVALEPLPEHPFVSAIRVIWDVTFARGRVGYQPPMTPFLIAMLLAVLVAGRRDLRARMVLILAAMYLMVFMFLPKDARYLMPLLPLLAVSASVFAAKRFPRAIPLLSLLAIAPGVAYIGYRLFVMGLPPIDASSRAAETRARVPAYAALQRAGASRVYVCGGEQLQYFARGTLLGDHDGPHSYARVITPDAALLAMRLRALDVEYYLVVPEHCSGPRMDGVLELEFADAGAQLWRVQRPPRRSSS